MKIKENFFKLKINQLENKQLAQVDPSKRNSPQELIKILEPSAQDSSKLKLDLNHLEQSGTQHSTEKLQQNFEKELGEVQELILFNSDTSAESVKEEIQQNFLQTMQSFASNEAQYHTTLNEVYGSRYDRKIAEKYRQQFANGEVQDLPPITFLDTQELGNAYGAYSADSQQIYLNSLIMQNPQFASEVYLEEFGHHLDQKLKNQDTQGDEGEMFRRLVTGEKLSLREKQNIRNENDQATISYNGKEEQVEYFFNNRGGFGPWIDPLIGKNSIPKNIQIMIEDFAADLLKGIREVPKAIRDFFRDLGLEIVGAVIYAAGQIVLTVKEIFQQSLDSRGLNSEERAILEPIFGNSIDYDAVKIKTGDAGSFFSDSNAGIAHGNNLIMHANKETVGQERYEEILVHEMVHIWQYQNFGVGIFGTSVVDQSINSTEESRDWTKAAPEKGWNQLKAEQQAELIEQLFFSGYFDEPLPENRTFFFDTNGDGQDEDLTAYAAAAMESLLRGEGKPVFREGEITFMETSRAPRPVSGTSNTQHIDLSTPPEDAQFFRPYEFPEGFRDKFEPHFATPRSSSSTRKYVHENKTNSKSSNSEKSSSETKRAEARSSSSTRGYQHEGKTQRHSSNSSSPRMSPPVQENIPRETPVATPRTNTSTRQARHSGRTRPTSNSSSSSSARTTDTNSTQTESRQATPRSSSRTRARRANTTSRSRTSR
ncbi:MAG: hypothetical protein H7A32_00845 [Deltaproteobacteria bacterium]|nr:hypothetical protein [Deltaproteobacteria bacterium]